MKVHYLSPETDETVCKINANEWKTTSNIKEVTCKRCKTTKIFKKYGG